MIHPVLAPYSYVFPPQPIQCNENFAQLNAKLFKHILLTTKKVSLASYNPFHSSTFFLQIIIVSIQHYKQNFGSPTQTLRAP